MAKRPVFWPELGEFFQSFRKAKGWGQRHAAELATRRGLSALTRQVMLRLEAGQTKNPDPEVLRALAVLYDLPYDSLVSQWVKHRYDVEVATSRDLGSHLGSRGSASSQGGVDATARILELERQVTNLTATLSRVQDVADNLTEVLVQSADEQAATQPTKRRRRGG